jgi:hypothetical protein
MQGFEWTTELLRYLLGSVVLGLDVLRQHGVIHRDIKPENVLITKEGRVKIGDFGICKKAPRAYTFVGTPEYMAPVSSFFFIINMLVRGGLGRGFYIELLLYIFLFFFESLN